jgi:hypothetical protein
MLFTRCRETCEAVEPDAPLATPNARFRSRLCSAPLAPFEHALSQRIEFILNPLGLAPRRPAFLYSNENEAKF